MIDRDALFRILQPAAPSEQATPSVDTESVDREGATYPSAELHAIRTELLAWRAQNRALQANLVAEVARAAERATKR